MSTKDKLPSTKKKTKAVSEWTTSPSPLLNCAQNFYYGPATQNGYKTNLWTLTVRLKTEKKNKPSLRAMETLQRAIEKAASEEENPEELLDLAKDLDEDSMKDN